MLPLQCANQTNQSMQMWRSNWWHQCAHRFCTACSSAVVMGCVWGHHNFQHNQTLVDGVPMQAVLSAPSCCWPYKQYAMRCGLDARVVVVPHRGRCPTLCSEQYSQIVGKNLHNQTRPHAHTPRTQYWQGLNLSSVHACIWRMQHNSLDQLCHHRSLTKQPRQ